jgi:hypothetical protein
MRQQNTTTKEDKQSGRDIFLTIRNTDRCFHRVIVEEAGLLGFSAVFVGHILPEGSKKRTALILRGLSHYLTLKMKVVRSCGTSGSNLHKHTAPKPKIPAPSQCENRFAK